MPHQQSIWFKDAMYNYLWRYKHDHHISFAQAVRLHIKAAQKHLEDEDKVRELNNQVHQMEKAINAYRLTQKELEARVQELEGPLAQMQEEMQ